MSLRQELKNELGYTEEVKNCKTCIHFKEDMSTDNFGSGDQCTRNIDVSFSVKRFAICNRWNSRSILKAAKEQT